MPNSLNLLKRINEPTDLGDLQMQPGTLVSITGHCGKAPEVRQAGSKMVASVGVAVSWGKRPDQTTVWFNVDAWEDMADILAEFDRGDAISVTGPRKSREYNEKVYWSITAWEISRPAYKKREGAPKSAPKQAQQEVDDGYGDLPF